jgi:hypothetical protein
MEIMEIGGFFNSNLIVQPPSISKMSRMEIGKMIPNLC